MKSHDLFQGESFFSRNTIAGSPRAILIDSLFLADSNPWFAIMQKQLTRLISTKLGSKHSWLKGIHFFSQMKDLSIFFFIFKIKIMIILIFFFNPICWYNLNSTQACALLRTVPQVSDGLKENESSI